MKFILTQHAQEEIIKRKIPIQVTGDKTMKATYDVEVDVLRINWSEAEIQESDSVSPGVILDYDAEGNVVGLEILNASQKIKNFDSLTKVQPLATQVI